eukprot:9836419-Lingulodinium_polyedra.AAC.1
MCACKTKRCMRKCAYALFVQRWEFKQSKSCLCWPTPTAALDDARPRSSDVYVLVGQCGKYDLTCTGS